MVISSLPFIKSFLRFVNGSSCLEASVRYLESRFRDEIDACIWRQILCVQKVPARY